MQPTVMLTWNLIQNVAHTYVHRQSGPKRHVAPTQDLEPARLSTNFSPSAFSCSPQCGIVGLVEPFSFYIVERCQFGG